MKDTNTRTIVLERYVSRLHTNQHDTIRFEMEQDGQRGFHHTDICKGCKLALLDGQHDIEDVQQMYEVDLERMAEADEAHRVPESTTLHATTLLAARRVVRVL